MTIRWVRSATEGVKYTVAFSKNSAFTNLDPIDCYETSDNYMTFERQNDNGGFTWYFKVMAWKPGYASSAWKIGSNGAKVLANLQPPFP